MKRGTLAKCEGEVQPPEIAAGLSVSQEVVRGLVVAAAYFGAAVVSTLVSGPLGSWSVVWLPCGVSLAVFLVWGFRAWPGVFLGALLACLWELRWVDWSVGGGHRGIAIAGAAVAGVVGPWVGAFLVRRGSEWPEGVWTEWGASRFYLLGGLVSGVCGGLLLVLFWVPTGIVPLPAGGYFLVSQILARALGASVLAPLLLLPNHENLKIWGKVSLRMLVPRFVILISVLMLLGYVSSASVRHLRSEFDELAFERFSAIEGAAAAHLESLSAIRNLWESSQEVERQEFRTFVQGTLRHNRALGFLLWAPEISHEDVSAFRAWLAQGQEGKVAPVLDGLFRPVMYAEPADQWEKSMGVDLSSMPEIAEAMTQVRQSETPLATRSFEWEKGKRFVAVIQWISCDDPLGAGSGGNWVYHRPGYAVAFFDVDRLLSEALRPWVKVPVELVIRDMNGFPASGGVTMNLPLAVHDRLTTAKWPVKPEHAVRQLNFAGRRWEIAATAHQPMMVTRPPWNVATAQSAGFALSTLLGVILMSAMGRTRRVEEGFVAAKQAAEDAREKVEVFFRVSLDLMCVAGMDGYFKRINPAFSETLGYSDDELLTRPFLEFVHPEDVEKTIHAVEQLAGGDPLIRFQNRYRDHVGRHLWLEWSAVPDSKGELIYAAARNVTEQRKAEDDLRRSNAELEQFAYVASHDLQEPLRMVTSFAQLLQRRYQGKLGEDADEYIHHVVDGTERMRRLILGLLELSRIGRKGQALQSIDSSEALKMATGNLKIAIEESEVEVHIGELPVVMADRDQLARVFQNLIGNAIKYGRDKGAVISIHGEWTSGKWLFTVEDNGPGIPPEQRERVFQIFQRLHSRDQVPGTGMGLAICRRIIGRHGGEIWIEPTESGGAAFKFTLNGDRTGNRSTNPVGE